MHRTTLMTNLHENKKQQHQKNLLPFCFPFAGGRMELSCGRFSQLVIDYELIAVTLAQFLVEEVYSLVNIIKMFRFFIIITGDSPYPRFKAREVASLLERGYRMQRPVHISEEL